MNRYNHYLVLSVCIMVLVILTGCTFSRQKTKAAPTVNPSILATNAAATSQVSAQQTKQASIPTAIPPTATLLVSPISGTSLKAQDDKSTIFIDSKAGIQLTIPPGWLAVRPNEDEYYKAFTLDAVLSSPEINDRLTKLQSINSDYFRLDAIDIRPGHVVDGLISVMSVNFQPDDFRSLEKIAEEARAGKSPFKEYKLISTNINESTKGMRSLIIEESWRGSVNGTVYYRAIVFNLTAGLFEIVIQTNINFKETVLPDYELVVNSLTLTNP